MHSLPILNQIAAKKSLLMSKILNQNRSVSSWNKIFCVLILLTPSPKAHLLLAKSWICVCSSKGKIKKDKIINNYYFTFLYIFI